MAKKTSRPGRTLLIFLLAIVVLYGAAALGQTWKPRLGLDLEGGTRITLTAIGKDKPSATKLKEAAGIIDSRVNGSGVSESEVSTQGGKNIIVEIPGKKPRTDLVESVERTAQLRFRLVYGQGANGTPATSSPSASSSPGASPSATATKSTKPEAGKKSATPRPRPAFDVPAATPKPKPKPKATPTGTPTVTATNAPAPQTQQTQKGAPVDDPLEWTLNPGSKWLKKYAEFTCPPKGADSAPIKDDPDQPLISCDENGNKFLMSKAIIEGTQLKSASSGTASNSLSSFAVNLSFKSSGRQVFADVSRKLADGSNTKYTGGLFAIVLDGKVLSSPGFNEPILDGNAQITGTFTEAEARSLANSLKYGALPIRFDQPPTVETIGPSLAGDQLSAGIFAGVVGLAIVMLYCLLYYRGLGLVVIASLVIAAVITYATVLVLAKAAGFTLTLPGIAGLIVAVGITADSFIVYFERIRDEMRDGKSMRVAVEAGWLRARNTCLAADAVSFLAAVVLYIFAIGVVKGFAFTLGISTIIDVVVFFWFTKPMMTLLARRTFFNSGSRYSGLSDETLGVDTDPRLAGGVL